MKTLISTELPLEDQSVLTRNDGSPSVLRLALRRLSILALALVVAEPVAAQPAGSIGGKCGLCGKWYIGSHSCPYARSGGGSSSSGSWDRGSSRPEGASRQNWDESARWRQAAYQANEKGNAAYREENWDHAIFYYEQALSWSPNDHVIWQNLQNARQQKEWARQRKERDEKARQLRESARVAESAGDYKAASFYLYQALNLDPHNHALSLKLTEVIGRQKEIEKKEEEFRQAFLRGRIEQDAEGKKRAEEEAQKMAARARAAGARGDWKSAVAYLEWGEKIAFDNKPFKQMLTDARKRETDQRITQAQQEKIRDILVAGVANLGTAPAASGLTFEPLPSRPGNGGGRVELKFPAVDAPITIFDKGSTGSAPVTVPSGKTPSTAGSDPVVQSLNVQIIGGRYGLPGQPPRLVSVRGSGMVNPLDANLTDSDRRRLEPPKLPELARMNKEALEESLQLREEAALREALRQSSKDMTRTMKGLEEANILRAGEPLLKQLNDPKIAAAVEAAVKQVQVREWQREQAARQETRYLRTAIEYAEKLENEKTRREAAAEIAIIEEVQKRVGDLEFKELVDYRTLRQIDREDYLNELRHHGYVKGEFTYEDLLRRAKTEPRVRIWIKPLVDLQEVWKREEEKLRLKYQEQINEEVSNRLRERSARQ